MQDVLGDHKEGSHVIIVTRGSPDSVSLEDEKIMKEHVEYYQIKVSTVMIPKRFDDISPVFDMLAQISRGKAHSVRATGPVSRYRELLRAFNDIIDGEKITVHESAVKIKEVNLTTEGSFLIDPLLGSDIQFEIFVEDVEEHGLKSVTFTDGMGTVYGPYTRLKIPHPVVNMVKINHRLSGSPLGEPGQWKYKVDNKVNL